MKLGIPQRDQKQQTVRRRAIPFQGFGQNQDERSRKYQRPLRHNDWNEQIFGENQRWDFQQNQRGQRDIDANQIQHIPRLIGKGENPFRREIC